MKQMEQTKEALILRYRKNALYIGLNLARRWHCPLSKEEIQSCIDIALCRAAQRYQARSSAHFLSYAFLYIKGELIKTIISESKSASELTNEGTVSSTTEMESIELTCGAQNTPESLTLEKEIKTLCEKTLSHLSTQEQKMLRLIVIEEGSMTDCARELGYSRGHLYEVNKRTLKKAREFWEQEEKHSEYKRAA